MKRQKKFLSKQTMTSQPIPIHQHMSITELKALKPRGASTVTLLVDGERHPERTYPADNIEFFSGINGKVVFE